MKNTTTTTFDLKAYLSLLNEAHERSALSLREVAESCDLDPSYACLILKGARKPQRDVLIALGFTYGLERVEVDELLLLAGYPPLGRSALRQYRQKKATDSTNPTQSDPYPGAQSV